MPAHATDGINAEFPANSNADTTHHMAFEAFMLGSSPVTRREIAAFIATDGLPFLAYEESWCTAHTRALYNQIGELEQRLTGVDCQSYVSGMTQYLDDPEKLKSFVTGFTRALLSRWELI